MRRTITSRGNPRSAAACSEREDLRPPVDQRQVDHADVDCSLVNVYRWCARRGIVSLQLDHDADPVAIGFVANVGIPSMRLSRTNPAMSR